MSRNLEELRYPRNEKHCDPVAHRRKRLGAKQEVTLCSAKSDQAIYDRKGRVTHKKLCAAEQVTIVAKNTDRNGC